MFWHVTSPHARDFHLVHRCTKGWVHAKLDFAHSGLQTASGMNLPRRMFVVSVVLAVGLLGCGKSTHGGATPFPLVTPPVKAAAPAGYGGSASVARETNELLSPSDFQSRFFNPLGSPTDLFNILQGIDDRITGFNNRLDSTFATCMTTTPVEYTLSLFGGQSVPMYVQCSEVFSNNTGFAQYGVNGNNTYVFVSGGVGRTATIATQLPDAGISVQLWVGMGDTNGADGGACGSWSGCSYGVMQIAANPAVPSFEMSVAGVGFGYCGAQLKSDGQQIYAVGSTDMGSTCVATDTLCVAASDATTAATCGSALSSFALPALGRKAATSFAASAYPTSPNVLLNGTSTDDIHFGPTAPLE
jgi:hypothetical protein